MKKHLLVFFAGCIVCSMLPGCYFNFDRVGAWRNKTIDQDLRDEIAVLNRKLFRDIMTSNVKGVKQAMSEALLKQSGKTIDTIVKSFGDNFKAKEYKVLDEYYNRSIKDVSNMVLQSDKENNNDYKLEFVAINKETFVSVMVSTGLPVNCMLLAIYGKYYNGWKLNILRMGEYSVLDQTAPEYYNVAITQFSKGNTLDAAEMIIIASKLAHPAGQGFSYLNDYEMKDTYSVIIKDITSTYHFPIMVPGVKTKPAIVGISPQLKSEGQPQGILPVIKYISSIPIADTIAVKAENISVQKSIGEVFKGIDKNKPGIIYQVYNKMPSDSVPVNHFNIVQTIKYSTHY